jgi:hypothetical protein
MDSNVVSGYFGTGLLFEKLQSRSQIKDFLALFERIRKPRTSRIASRSTASSHMSHMPNGPEQEERDRLLPESIELCPNPFNNPEFQVWMFAYDTKAEVERAWETYVQHSSLLVEGRVQGDYTGETPKSTKNLPSAPVAVGN